MSDCQKSFLQSRDFFYHGIIQKRIYRTGSIASMVVVGESSNTVIFPCSTSSTIPVVVLPKKLPFFKVGKDFKNRADQ